MQTLLNVRVDAMQSPRTGRTVANQYVITTPEGRYFQSYQTVIAFKANDGRVFLDENAWNYSTTTSKYRGEFLNEGLEETRRKIKEKVYTLVDLNKGE